MRDEYILWTIIGTAISIAFVLLLAWKSKAAKQVEKERDDLRREVSALRIRQEKLENDLARTEHRRRETEEQAALQASLSARIRHDVPKRLHYLWKYLEAKLPDDEDKKQAVEDLETIVDNITAQVGGEIRRRTAKALAETTDESAVGSPINDLLAWILKVHNFSDRSEIKLESNFVFRGPRWSWDLLMTNILSNAMFYAGERGRILIVLRTREGKGEVEVMNDGRHIPKDNLDKLFLPGFTTKGPDGHGLGLHIAQEAAQGLGGFIKAPENLGIIRKRVRFTVTNLPIYLPPVQVRN